MAMSDSFVDMAVNLGALYLWYYIFRPCGANPSYELALDAAQIDALRRFMVEARTRHPIALIDSYWRADGSPFCPAIEGLSHHVNPSGYLEPCPVLQYAKHRLNSESDIAAAYGNDGVSVSLKNALGYDYSGCIFMEDPALLASHIEESGFVNTSNRDNYLSALRAAPPLVSHSSAAHIAERSLIYRFAKRNAFFGMGSYG